MRRNAPQEHDITAHSSQDRSYLKRLRIGKTTSPPQLQPAGLSFPILYDPSPIAPPPPSPSPSQPTKTGSPQPLPRRPRAPQIPPAHRPQSRRRQIVGFSPNLYANPLARPFSGPPPAVSAAPRPISPCSPPLWPPSAPCRARPAARKPAPDAAKTVLWPVAAVLSYICSSNSRPQSVLAKALLHAIIGFHAFSRCEKGSWPSAFACARMERRPKKPTIIRLPGLIRLRQCGES